MIFHIPIGLSLVLEFKLGGVKMENVYKATVGAIAQNGYYVAYDGWGNREEVLKRDIPWEHYMSTKLISGTCLQLLRRYDHKPESQLAPLLEEFKLCKVRSVQFGQKGIPYLNTYDDRTIRYPTLSSRPTTPSRSIWRPTRSWTSSSCICPFMDFTKLYT
ncbi:hypothetical protein ZEAMMB73_Zm00001d007542 [Zea mays]|uniref:Small ribosomal subunit protein eS4 central region domain-containing protein n=1 Tax=Zea mays TaxID=4577 RepID=A0A1D6F758_MAIZE|nr:hypothetical protein ZEAMMB73_Zm00001d007542 [Zea mays]